MAHPSVAHLHSINSTTFTPVSHFHSSWGRLTLQTCPQTSQTEFLALPPPITATKLRWCCASQRPLSEDDVLTGICLNATRAHTCETAVSQQLNLWGWQTILVVTQRKISSIFHNIMKVCLCKRPDVNFNHLLRIFSSIAVDEKTIANRHNHKSFTFLSYCSPITIFITPWIGKYSQQP